MKSIFLLLLFSIFLTNCGGYLPSPPSNWSANPSEMHVWNPPDEQNLETRRKNQEYLDNLTGEIERLFVNHASLSQEELKLDEKIRKIDYQISETEKELSIQIGKELERNKKMRADLNSARAKYIVQKELLRELTKVKKPLIFSSKDYNSAMKAFSEGKYTKSLKLFNKLLSQNPPKFLADNILFGIGSSYFKLKNYQKAKTYFNKIITEFKSGDKNFISYAMLGLIHNFKGEKSRALYLLDEALKSNPPDKIKPLLNSLVINIGKN